MNHQVLPSLVEVRLTKTAIAVACELVDELQNVTSLPVTSIHMTGAKQEVTLLLQQQGFRPRSRWEPNTDGYSARVFERA